MNRPEKMTKYVALLRGINVGGHHKVPMAELRLALEKINLKNVVTLLNSGNVLFESDSGNLENTMEEHLEKTFGFPIPILLRKYQTIVELYTNNPFKNIKVTKDIRLYLSFLKNETDTHIKLPYKSDDQSFEIIEQRIGIICSVLDLSVTKTPKAMDALEKFYGK